MFTGNNIKCTCAIAWMSKALKSYDSVVEQELQTMDCKYEQPGTEGAQPFGDFGDLPNSRRPKSIYEYVTSAEVARSCKLPAALLKAEGNPVYFHEYLEGGHAVGADHAEDANRAALLAGNDGLLYESYGEVVRRFLVSPHDRPTHPFDRAPGREPQ